MARPTNNSIFLRHVREAGGRIGNGNLQRQLGWAEDRYWKVHEELVDSGLIAKGRGQGGSVILIVPETEIEIEQSTNSLPKTEAKAVKEELIAAQAEAAMQPSVRELDLYEPALNQLKLHWKGYAQLENCVFETTALQGRRDTGGSWSRPDLVAVGLRSFEYLSQKMLEIHSFEIKAEYDVSIKGVLEALSHREMATRSYVIFHTNGQAWEDFAEAQRIEQLAARHGVGVIVASKIDSFLDCWEERVTASRSTADPENLDRFIKSTMSDASKSQILRWR